VSTRALLQPLKLPPPPPPPPPLLLPVCTKRRNADDTAAIDCIRREPGDCKIRDNKFRGLFFYLQNHHLLMVSEWRWRALGKKGKDLTVY